MADYGMWEPVNQALSNVTNTAINLGQMQQQERHRRAIEANDLARLDMQKAEQLRQQQTFDIQKPVMEATAKFEADKLLKQQELMNKSYDFTTDPHYLAYPEEARPQLLKWLSDNGYADPTGKTTVGNLHQAKAVIESSAPIFQTLTAPILQAKKNTVLTAWGEYQTALQKGDKAKAQEAFANYQKTNADYMSSTNAADSHVAQLSKLATDQVTAGMKAEAEAKKADEANATRLKAAQIAAGGKEGKALTAKGELSDKDIIMPQVRQLPKLKQAAQDASINAAKYDNLSKILAKGNAGGIAGGLKAVLAPVAESMGMDVTNLSEAQAFQLMARAGAGGMRLALIGPGQVSNYEQDLIQKLSGGSWKVSRAAAQDLFKFYAAQSRQTVKSYNQTIDDLSQTEPRISKIYPKIKDSAGILPKSNQPQPLQGTRKGNMVEVGGKQYPIKNGIVTINGQAHRVE